MEFQEFCAAAVSVHQLEALDRWEQHARSAYEHFEKEGNRAIVIDELASVRDLPPCSLSSIPVWWTSQYFLAHSLLHAMEYFIVNKIYLFSQELGLSPSVPLHVVLQDWIRHTDGKLSFLGFVKLLHGMSSRSLSKMR
jgi:kinase